MLVDERELAQFVLHMQIARLSQQTIQKRMELVRRLAAYLQPKSLFEAERADLLAFQATFATLAPNSANIYTRHLQALYRWAVGMRLMDVDPSATIPVPQVHRGLPHPATVSDLRTIFTCTTGGLRTAYVLAAFAGLRRSEITGLEGQHLDLNPLSPSAWVLGKGGKERVVPLLPPVVHEIGHRPVRGHLVRLPNGKPFTPNRLSMESTTHLHGLGLATTLHSMRHFFATEALRISKDILLVRDILGHGSVATTQIYTQSDTSGMHERLAAFTQTAASLLQPRLRAVE